MAGSYLFDGKTIRMLRNQATSWWLQRLAILGPEGWSISSISPSPVLNFFKPLRLKPAYSLHAYQYRNCASGKGVVWALEKRAKLPEPDSSSPDQLPRPVGALADYMEAIEGDQSPWSYVCASLLSRELEDFGAYGSDISWMTYLILDCDPWVQPNPAGHALAGQGFAKDLDHWTWLQPKPVEWSPLVRMKGRSVMVQFYSFNGYDQQRILLTVDNYVKGRYTFKRNEKTVATGPPGINW